MTIRADCECCRRDFKAADLRRGMCPNCRSKHDEELPDELVDECHSHAELSELIYNGEPIEEDVDGDVSYD